MIPLLRASHFQPSVAVTATAAALAWSAGRAGGVVWVALAVLVGQLSVGWSNDYIDRRRDALAGRRDKPIVSGAVPAAVVGTSAVIAALLCVPLSFLSGWRAGLVHMVAVAMAWLYNLGMKATAASAAAFAIAFGVLPAFVTLGLRGHPLPAAWATIAAAIIGVAAHFLNTLPDLADDAETGIRGLPHRVGATGSLLVGAGLLSVATAIIAVAPPGAPGAVATGLSLAAAVTIAGVVVAVVAGRNSEAWPLVLVTAGFAVLSLVAQGSNLRA